MYDVRYIVMMLYYGLAEVCSKPYEDLNSAVEAAKEMAEVWGNKYFVFKSIAVAFEGAIIEEIKNEVYEDTKAGKTKSVCVDCFHEACCCRELKDANIKGDCIHFVAKEDK